MRKSGARKNVVTLDDRVALVVLNVIGNLLSHSIAQNVHPFLVCLLSVRGIARWFVSDSRIQESQK